MEQAPEIASEPPRLQRAGVGTSRQRRTRPARPQPFRSPQTGRVSPSAAVIARPFLVALPVLTFLVPALLLTMLRQPTYTAEARLLVGGFNVEAQAVPGFVEASRTLASTFARLVETPTITEPVAAALQLPPDEVSVDATAVPESSIIRVEGSSDDEERAVELADAAATALLDYASQTGGGAEAAEELLVQYRQAFQEFNVADANRQRVAAAIEATPTPTVEQRVQLAEAEAAAAAARLRAETIANRYSEAQRSVGGSSNVDLVAPATSLGNDRRSAVQLALVASVALGLVAGVALATLVVNRTAPPLPSRTGGADGRR